jgi:hypothetical protein
MIQRRTFLAGVFSAFAAPAIVRAASIMPVKVMPRELTFEDFSDVIHMIEPMESPFLRLYPAGFPKLRGWDYYRLEVAGHRQADSVASTANKRT